MWGDVDLGLLPIPFHSKLNSRKYIIISRMICNDPDIGIPNVKIYRYEVKGKDKLGAMRRVSMSDGDAQIT